MEIRLLTRNELNSVLDLLQDKDDDVAYCCQAEPECAERGR